MVTGFKINIIETSLGIEIIFIFIVGFIKIIDSTAFIHIIDCIIIIRAAGAFIFN